MLPISPKGLRESNPGGIISGLRGFPRGLGGISRGPDYCTFK